MYCLGGKVVAAAAFLLLWCERGKKKERAMKRWKAAGGLVLHRIEYTGAGTTPALINSRARLTAWHGCKCCEHGMMTGTGSSSTHALQFCSAMS